MITSQQTRDARHERKGGRDPVFHFFLTLGGWTAFAWFWLRAFDRLPPENSAVGVLVAAGLLIGSISLTVTWVRHSFMVSRRYGNRRIAVREVEPDWSHDALGRPVAGPVWEILQGASEVEITVDNRTDRKIYRTN